MAITGEQLNVSDLDFNDIKTNLINYFKNSETEFTDWDFEGSNLNNIIDLLAYNTHYNAMLAHMAVNESFIDSAQLRSSVVSAAKLLGYVPRSYSAAKASLVGQFMTNSDAPNEFIIPRGTAISTTYDGEKYQFVVLNEVCTLEKREENGLYYYYTAENSPLIAYEGRLVTSNFEANGFNDSQKYEIDDEDIDISTLRVIVYPTSAKTPGSGTLFSRYSDINANPDSAIYFINENWKGRYELTFGNGSFGRKLNAGNVIEIQYLVTSGSRANGINTPFQLVGTLSGNVTSTVSLSMPNGQRISGGSDKENIEKLKQNAMNNFTTQNRAVTADDYRNLILSKFPSVQSVSVWGGEDNIPPMYGKTFISARPQGSTQSDYLSDVVKQDILNYLSNKKVLAITPEIVDPEYCNIVLDVYVKYNLNISNLSASELQNEIRTNVLQSYNSDILNGFDTIFRHSQFIRAVDNYNKSILNSLVRVYLKQTISVPADSTVSTFTVKFGSRLTPDDNKVIINSSISGVWTLNDERVFIADEPGRDSLTRNVYIYTIRNNIRSRIRDVGEIDLTTGIMELSQLFSDNDINITFIVNPYSNDIIGKRNLLLEIDTENSIVRAYPDEIARGGTSRAVEYTSFSKDRIASE